MIRGPRACPARRRAILIAWDGMAAALIVRGWLDGQATGCAAPVWRAEPHAACPLLVILAVLAIALALSRFVREDSLLPGPGSYLQACAAGLALALVLTTALTLCLSTAWDRCPGPAGWAVLAGGLSLAFAFPRGVLASIARRSAPPRIGFLGDGRLARRLEAMIAREGRGVVVSLHGRSGGLPAVCRQTGLDAVVVPVEELDAAGRRRLHRMCGRLGMILLSEVDLHEQLLRATPLEALAAAGCGHCGVATSAGSRAAARRLVDLLLALALAPLVLMLCLGVTLAIGLCRDGPVFYHHIRVGRHGRPFRLFKFRTMRVDAERDAVTWSSNDDVRVTPLGRFLRRWRLDELPQFVNILRGDMAFIGPRPERPEFVATLAGIFPCYACRHGVKPGLTGWAQVNLPYAASIEAAGRKLEYDLYYVRHRNPRLDALILARTLTAIWRGPWPRGAVP